MRPQLPDFKSANVLVVGDLMLDRYWYGDTTRVSPEAPVPVVLVGDIEERAGGAGNVALNIASLGGNATVIGLTGDDEAARALAVGLEKKGVDCVFEQLSGYSTITKLRVISRHQQLIRMDFEDGFFGYDSSGLLEKYTRNLDKAGIVILSDYGKGSLQAINKIIQLANSKQIPIVVDPKGTDFGKYRGATLLTPNLAEFEAVVGNCSDDNDLVNKGEKLRESVDLQALLITRSEKGMTLIERGKDAMHIPTLAREVFDVTGAGDTVISVLAAAMAAGQSMCEAMQLANLAAGVVVAKLGTATASVSELQQAMRDTHVMPQGEVNQQQLCEFVKQAQHYGEKVVMTNGCFDILHSGHVAYLQQARELGDRLIVAVNSDASVQILKGKARPVNALKHRMAVLAGLGSVDWVVPFEEETPEQLICSVLPDILVKGGDYSVDEIAGGPCVKAANGKVIVLKFVQGQSTTNMINAIKKL